MGGQAQRPPHSLSPKKSGSLPTKVQLSLLPVGYVTLLSITQAERKAKQSDTRRQNQGLIFFTPENPGVKSDRRRERDTA